VSTAPQMIQRFGKMHPVILAYLMAAGDGILNQKEREELLFIGMVIWQIMLEGDRPLSEITETVLEEKEEANFKLLEHLEYESGQDLERIVEKVFSDYNQFYILGYVMENLTKFSEEISVGGESVGRMFIYLKTTIDCFDV